jgi:sialidase-1
MRNSGASRYIATSSDAGQTWVNMKRDAALVEPVCQGSLVSGMMGSKFSVFFSNPASTKREKMTIRLSEDNGGTWPKKVEVYSGSAAYSDLVLLSGTEVGILYEAGKASAYTGISFKTVSLNDFK